MISVIYFNCSLEFSTVTLLQCTIPHLTDEERDFFMRGRNAHTGNVPKHAGPAVYHAATGLESLFGALWLMGRNERLEELFAIAWDNKEEK